MFDLKKSIKFTRNHFQEKQIAVENTEFLNSKKAMIYTKLQKNKINTFSKVHFSIIDSIEYTYIFISFLTNIKANDDL